MKQVTIEQTGKIGGIEDNTRGLIVIQQHNHKSISKFLERKVNVVVSFQGKDGLVKFEQKAMMSKRGVKYILYIQKDVFGFVSDYLKQDLKIKMTIG